MPFQYLNVFIFSVEMNVADKCHNNFENGSEDNSKDNSEKEELIQKT